MVKVFGILTSTQKKFSLITGPFWPKDTKATPGSWEQISGMKLGQSQVWVYLAKCSGDYLKDETS